ncbi:uncharacterized protein LOC115444515 isoform X2 [Manduca sexta]|nr:uncharacterized protein LOC115444515 isoform X2 [Manduca sexta]
MASGYKSHKTELVAIYRLEFYRKQKNWKFAHEAKKNVKTPRSKYTELRKSLNETYHIETETNNESSPLNHGFLDDAPVLLSDKPLECPYVSASPDHAPMEELQHSLPWPADQQYLEAEREDPQYLEAERDDQQWWDGNQICGPSWSEPVATSPHPGMEPWAASCDCVDGPRESAKDVTLEELVSAIQTCGSLADLSGQCSDPPECACADHDASSESLAEFIRGAHLAPHSSEADLLLDTRCGACDTCDTCGVARLSQRALAQAVRAHARSLHALLREARHREQHKLSRTCCSEQLFPLPMEPAQELQSPQPLKRQDTFTVSCSNVTTGGSGRGRGRLHRDHIIGIGMGRPFRFT